ncbi:MAG: glutamate--tRNA ligase [Clostridia bacterium]
MNKLSSLIFSNLTLTKEEVLNKYTPRTLTEGAKVTRIAPSPTGFMHLGNLYGAIIDERLAHQSNGIFYLRIEDTDKKREVENGVETIITAFKKFNLTFDEGATLTEDIGEYGPYHQSLRADIYKVFARELLEKNLVYPCFCTEEELADMRATQEATKENFGYYGKYAKYADFPVEEAIKKIEAGESYVLRLRSSGSIENKVPFEDLVKGKIDVTQNNQHVVILKADGIPTYHFAHVIDDFLMGTTHVVRGEEWLATLPIHIELFDVLGLKRPKYLHTSQLMTIDEETKNKRKLSKRKDPELALDFYHEEGFPIASVLEYLMTLLNSNFEDWRRANPDEDINNFEFSVKKMPKSGALFDILKLHDISKTVISKMTADEVYEALEIWSSKYDAKWNEVLAKNPDFSKAILQIGRGGKKPRKDIVAWSGAKNYMGFMFDEYFTPDYTLPDNLKADAKAILEEYINIYDDNDEQNVWFDKIKALAPKFGYASDTKEYKANPDNFKGHSGDISIVIRVATTGTLNSPDMYSVLKILGKDKVCSRIKLAIEKM